MSHFPSASVAVQVLCPSCNQAGKLDLTQSVQISYADDMDHLLVLREKIGRLREEIADIQKLNEEFRRNGGQGTEAQIAHGQRSDRLQSIQQELVRLADLGRKVVSTEQMKEKHRTRLHLVPQKRAS